MFRDFDIYDDKDIFHDVSQDANTSAQSEY